MKWFWALLGGVFLVGAVLAAFERNQSASLGGFVLAAAFLVGAYARWKKEDSEGPNGAKNTSGALKWVKWVWCLLGGVFLGSAAFGIIDHNPNASLWGLLLAAAFFVGAYLRWKREHVEGSASEQAS